MHIDVAKKIITALLFILVITLSMTLFLIFKTEDGKEPLVTDDPSAVTTAPESTDPPAVTDPVVSDPVMSDPVVSGPIVTDPVVTDPIVTEPIVTEPPVTEPSGPAGDAPAGLAIKTVLSADAGLPSFNLRAVCEATANENSSVTLTVSLYLDHKSLYMGKRNGTVTVGHLSESFSTQRISQDSETLTEELLCTLSGIFSYGETVPVYAKIPVRVTYGEAMIESLIIDGAVTLQ
ncbi:MAG: hypothetical protein IJD10_03010 [Clostridia bacterium]|nr:hypothetical protein [Clostridia bacterium]